MNAHMSSVILKKNSEKTMKAKEMNDQLNSTIMEISKLMIEIQDSYTVAADNSVLICQSPLDQFYEEEDRYRQILTKFTQTLFAESLSEDHPALRRHALVLRGLPPDSDLQRRLHAECRRLYEARRTGLEAEVAAEVSLVRARAQAEELQTALLRTRAGANAGAATVTESEHRAIVGRVHVLRAHVERLRRTEVPPLEEALYGGLAARVELAQLSLQEARHRFFLHRQRTLIRLLIRQRQWNTMLVMWHETERRSQKMLLRAMQRLQDDYDTLLKKTSPPIFEGQVDRHLPNLNLTEIQEALKAVGKERLAVPPSDISQCVVASERRENEDLNKELGALQAAAHRLCEVVFPDGLQGQPQVSYPEVQRALTEVKAHRKTLNQRASQFARRQPCETQG